MVREKNAKTASLIASVIIILASLVYVPDWAVVGLAKGCPLIARFGYSLFHVSLIHALLNVWCLLGIVFLYDIALCRLLAAYTVAVLAPGFLLTDVPTVGLSCVCYALLGSLAFQVRRRLYYQLCMAAYIALGFLFPSVNAAIHLYGYLAGLLVGLLTTPLPCFRR